MAVMAVGFYVENREWSELGWVVHSFHSSFVIRHSGRSGPNGADLATLLANESLRSKAMNTVSTVSDER